MFSRRLPSDVRPNALTQALQALRARREPVIDLTESNPTQAGIAYPDHLLAPLSDSASLRYQPHALGMPAARTAVAADQQRRGAVVDSGHVVLTASTSEAYSWLFKLLCDPGDAVLVPQPSYPLFEQLTALEGVVPHRYALEYHRRWSVDLHTLEAAPERTRAVVVVSPNNPTGSYLSTDELAHISAICRRRKWALMVDEVFADYPLEAVAPLTDIATRTEVLSFSLAGLSKTVGLPQLKMGWIIVGGPPAERAAALEGLELIADSYLSVATPVQVAAPRLLTEGASIREAIRERTQSNLTVLHAMARSFPACEVLRAGGGWSAVIRLPSVRLEEQLTLDLLKRQRVLVHPGYFFDFPRESYLILSLLPEPHAFRDGVARLFHFVADAD